MLPAAVKPADDSMTAVFLDPLNTLQSLSQTLFLSLSPIQARPPPPPTIQSLVQADTNLAAAVELARTHQAKQCRIETLKDQVLHLDEIWKTICAQLETGRCELESVVEEGEERIKAIEQAKQASIPYPELLAYAQSLSAFTSAPPNMPDLTLPGQPPPPLFFPPFPNEEKMRRGRLNAEAPLGLLGETHSVGRSPTLSPLPIVEPPRPVANSYHRTEHGHQQQFFDLDLDLNPDL